MRLTSRKLNIGTAQVGPCEPASSNVTFAAAPSDAEPPVYTAPPLEPLPTECLPVAPPPAADVDIAPMGDHDEPEDESSK